MSNRCAEISSSAAEARSQAAISERIVKLEQELAKLQIQSQLDKAELDAMEMVDQVVHYNQVKSKSIISQSADLQNYSNSIGSQHPQSVNYSVPVCLKSEVITSGYNYSPPVSSSVSQASNVTSLASGYTSSSMSVQPVIGSSSSANHGASYSLPTSSLSMSTQPVFASRSLVNHGAGFSVPSSHQSNFHGSCPCINPVDRSHLDEARFSSQAPICHTGDGNYFSRASPQNPSHVSQEYRANQSQFGSFPHPYNGFSTQQTLPGSYFNPSHVPQPQQFQSGYNTCPSVSRRPLPEPHQFQSGYNTCPSFSRRPLPELRQFSGEDLSDFLDYPSWRYSFQTLIQNSGISNSERIYYLGCYVKGKALETIKGYLALGDDNCYHAALNLLDECYGNHLVLCNAFRLKLDSWSKNSDFDRAGLRSYADFLNQCLSARNKFHLNILDDEFENDKMLEKLPSWMRGKWARIVCDSRRNIMSFPTFSEFVNFVTRESDLWIDPMPLTSSLSPSRSTTSSYTHSAGARSSSHVELTPNQSNYSSSPTSTTSRDQNCPSMSRTECDSKATVPLYSSTESHVSKSFENSVDTVLCSTDLENTVASHEIDQLDSSPPSVSTCDTQDCDESLCSTTQYVKTNNSWEADNFDLCHQSDYVPDVPCTSEISSIDSLHVAVYSPVSSCYDILKSSNSHHFVVPSHVMKVKHSRTNIPFVSILGHFSLWFALSALVFYVVFLKILKHRSGSSVKIKICGLEHF